jgi:hypothetical protein
VPYSQTISCFTVLVQLLQVGVFVMILSSSIMLLLQEHWHKNQLESWSALSTRAIIFERYLGAHLRGSGRLHCDRSAKAYPLRVFPQSRSPSFIAAARSVVLMSRECDPEHRDRSFDVAYYLSAIAGSAFLQRKGMGRLALYRQRRGGIKQELLRGVRQVDVSVWRQRRLVSLEKLADFSGSVLVRSINIRYVLCGDMRFGGALCRPWYLFVTVAQ